MPITIKIEGYAAARAAIEQLKNLAPAKLQEVVLESAININTAAKENVAVDTGLLRSEVIFNTTNGGMSAEIGTNNKYGPFIEFGTSPHFPPVEPLEEWASRHGMPKGTGFLIARAISQRGTPERPWLLPAYEGEKDNFISKVQAAVQDAAESVRK